MGELSQTIGKKLENFGNTLFANLGWEMLAQDLPIDCTRSTHKSPTAKSGEKKTHGIDILQSFYNPFSARKEAVIIECKNHQWKDFIPSNLNQWIEELLNTMECASTSPKAAPYLTDTTLTTGILLFNSSDNLYDYVKATDTLKKITIPRRRTPTMLYLADTGRLEKWFSLNNEITRIKEQNKEHNFGIIYPSVSGSQWDRQNIITPSYLFSDYIFAGYTKINEHENGTEKVDVKAVFFFDTISEDSMLYLLNMINVLQFESRTERKQEVHIYFFPEKADDKKLIEDYFTKIVLQSKPQYQIRILDNRRLSPVT